MFFFIITCSIDKNGNHRHSVTGFKTYDEVQCFPLPRMFLVNTLKIGSRWNDAKAAVTTTLSVEQILEKLNNNLNAKYHYILYRR